MGAKIRRHRRVSCFVEYKNIESALASKTNTLGGHSSGPIVYIYAIPSRLFAEPPNLQTSDKNQGRPTAWKFNFRWMTFGIPFVMSFNLFSQSDENLVLENCVVL